MITLQEIFSLRSNKLQNTKVKLVRHKDSRAEYRELLRNRQGILAYQREQAKNVFKGCDYIVSFIGGERKRSILFGVFSVDGVTQHSGKYYYDLSHVPEFSDLENRVVINWGDAALAWHQWYTQKKEVVEVLPQGYLGSFPGLLEFVLDYGELKRLMENPEANHDWKYHLYSVNGIYLILDTHTGQQYIGSAYGDGGIWQRWSEYARTRTGGNRELTRLLDSDPEYQRHFRYSILQTLPSNITAREVIKIECLYKEKLGSRIHGLNVN